MSDPGRASSSRKNFLVRLWTVLWRPSGRFMFATLVIFGGVWGILFWGGFNWGMEEANTLQFCISCHEMRDTVYQEYTAEHSLPESIWRASDLFRLPRPP